jgi:hypothetical protein
VAKRTKGSFFWKLLGFSFAIPAGVAVRKMLDRVWMRMRGSAPPKNPAGIAFGRLVAAWGAAGVYKKLTGKLPPGLESEGP